MRIAALALALILPGWAAAAECRLALALGLDVSASVSDAEYRLQATGTAAALRAPEVRALLLAPGPPVALAVFLWAGERGQQVVLPWRLIDSPARLEESASRIAARPRPPRDGQTAIGAAMVFAEGLFAAGPACDAATLDLSGDGENNAGLPPALARARPGLAGVTINALAVKGDLPFDHEDFATHIGALSAYFRVEVIRGPGAFVEAALDYRDFEAAMTRKLMRELAPLMLGAAP